LTRLLDQFSLMDKLALAYLAWASLAALFGIGAAIAIMLLAARMLECAA
jgi:hypothetical protein